MTETPEQLSPDIARDIIVARAAKKYILTGKTRNITEALRMYLTNDAGPAKQVPLFVTSPEIHQVKRIVSLIRPTCGECDAVLHLQVNARDPTGVTHATAWICKSCGVHYYSDMTTFDWLRELQNEARKQNLQKPDEPSPGDVPPGRKAPQV